MPGEKADFVDLPWRKGLRGEGCGDDESRKQDESPLKAVKEGVTEGRTVIEIVDIVGFHGAGQTPKFVTDWIPGGQGPRRPRG